MIEKTFAIDCDETIRSNIDEMVRIYNKEFGTSLTKEDVKEYDVSISFPLIHEKLGIPAHQYFFHDHAEEVFNQSSIIPGTKEAFDILSKYGKIYIVTWQEGDKNKKIVIDWLSKHGLNYDGIFFTKNKSLIHADYFIDDCQKYFHGNNCENGIMINRPYNRHIDECELLKDSNMESINRFSSLKEFADWFEENKDFL